LQQTSRKTKEDFVKEVTSNNCYSALIFLLSRKKTIKQFGSATQEICRISI